MPDNLNSLLSTNGINMMTLTAAINRLPRIKYPSLALFAREKRITQQTVGIEESNGVLSLIQSKERGETGTFAHKQKRIVRTFKVPHFPLEDVILPSEFSGVRAFGSDKPEGLEQKIYETLELLKRSHDLTHEHLCMGAKKGLILDADGSVLYNLFNEFNIKKNVVNFALNVEETDVPQKCREVLRLVEENMLADVWTAVHVDASPEFFDALIKHKSVKEIFLGHQAALEHLGQDSRKNFKLGGLVFNEVAIKHKDAEGNLKRFVDANKAHCFPIGTGSAYFTVIAPADFNETVNTLGQRYYSKAEPKNFDRGINIHTQSNVLPMCVCPGALIELKAQ